MENYVNIIKSENDNREYKYLTLDNKLNVLLISDVNSEKSAASLTLNIGASSDPPTIPGIAHFCEHMLFLGTEKYPEEGEFRKFISQNGGKYNASTSSEQTTYHFSIKSEVLPEALDRFAQFFISPLFNIDATSRELHAVDSEFQKNVLNDSRRKHFIDRSTAREGHAYQKFSTGNLETLETIPQQNNIDIRQVLLEFHRKFYSANIMSLAVLGRETIEHLEKICIPLFKDIKNSDAVVPLYNEVPYSDNELGLLIKIPTLKEIKHLELKFVIDDYFDEHYRTKPWRYIAHLIGHEGERSLLSLLKKKLWVNTLSASGFRGLKGFGFFTISMGLTTEGLDEIFEIIAICFQYIAMLKQKGLQEWIYKEKQLLSEINFRFKSKEKAEGYVTTLSKRMHSYPPEDVLYAPYRFDSFPSQLVNDLLNQMNPLNCRIIIQSQRFEAQSDKTVKYYNASYSVETLPKEEIEKWLSIPLNPDLHLPKENLFIPNNLDVVVPNDVKETKDVPVMYKDTYMCRFWWKSDDTFFLPKASLKILVCSPYASLTPSDVNHTSMYERLINDELKEFAYDARLAGMSYSVQSDHRGLYLGIIGYNSNQLILLEKILKQLNNLVVKDDRFNIKKKKLEEDLKNTSLDEPYRQIERLKYHVLGDCHWIAEERLEYLDELSVRSLKTFINSFRRTLYVEGLFCGNILENDVQEICEVVERILITENNATHMLPCQHLMHREHKLSKNVNYLYEKRSKIHTNSCVFVYLQVGLQEQRSRVLCSLFAHLINAPLYSELRTKEQLGYIVWSGLSRCCGVQGFRVLIQTSEPPAVVEKKIDDFIASFEERINAMTSEQFNDYKEGLAVKKLEKPKRLGEETGEYWSEISSKQYHFRRNESEVKILEGIQKEDILQFYQTYISPLSEYRKKIAFVMLGKDATSLAEGDHSWRVVGDILEFKSALSLYPRVMPYNNVPILVTRQ